MRRRTLLTAAGVSALALAGCASAGDSGGADGPETTPTTDAGTTADSRETTEPPGGGTTTEPPDDKTTLPESCPTSMGLDVDAEWPTDPDAASVATFVEAYERVYYREIVVDYEPETPLADYQLYGGVEGSPQETEDGWLVAYSGQGAVYQGSLFVAATTAEAPADADVVAGSEIENGHLASVVDEAANTGSAEKHVTETEIVKRYLDTLPALSTDVEKITERGQEEVLYVDVDGTVVRVTVTAGNFHGDAWWSARYYVTDRVVRRAEGEDADPREGELLECRREA